jgi:hypothetical protein
MQRAADLIDGVIAAKIIGDSFGDLLDKLLC